MYLATLSKHSHVNFDEVMVTIYKIYYLIQSRSITYGNMSGSTMSILADLMTRNNLDTNIITHDRNLIIIFPS